jgi:hypothetical protein
MRPVCNDGDRGAAATFHGIMAAVIKLLAVVALVALGVALTLVAGCAGAGGSAAPSGASGTGAPASPGPGSASGASSTDPLPHEDPGLEARLPREVDGKALTIFSIGPVAAAGNPGAVPIKDLAREIGDGTGSFGLAFASDPTSPTFNFFALRIPGADGGELVERYGALTLEDTSGGTLENLTLGDSDVVHVTSPGNPIGDVWFFATGDTLFGVQARTADRATELLALLP